MEKIYKGEIQRLMPIFQAMAEGRTIQFSAKGNSWTDIDGDEEGLLLDTLIDTPQRYRIKPEPKFRPFKDAEECWVEMCKHHPFGWVKTKQGTHRLIVLIDEERLMMGAQNTEWSYRTMFNEEFSFVDGAPFGVKEEE